MLLMTLPAFRQLFFFASMRVIIKQGMYHCKNKNDYHGKALFLRGEQFMMVYLWSRGRAVLVMHF
jgi:hypothetical protein